MEWFECKVSYEKENEDGKIKSIVEAYLVDAMSFTEAEAVIIEEVSSFISGDCDVKAVKKEKIYEMFKSENGEGKWFKTKVVFIVTDEITGKEKRTNVTMYLQTEEIDDVIKELRVNLKGSMADYEIAAVNETKILQVFEHKEKEEA